MSAVDFPMIQEKEIVLFITLEKERYSKTGKNVIPTDSR